MKQLYRILMVEDTQDDALLIMRQVQKGDFDVQFERVETEAAFISALESQKWDIILCDYKLPTFNGIEALRILKKRGDDIPFIFVSGTMGEERAVEAMKHGARDYVMKGNLKRLLPAIERELIESKIRKEHRQTEIEFVESEKKYRTLFETMSEGIVYEDHNGNIISANPAAERLLGISLDQMQRRTSLDPNWKAIHADGSPFPGDTHSLRVAATTGKPSNNEVMGIYNLLSGNYVWLSVNAIPEFLPGETKPFCAYAVFRDITAQKMAEEALKEIALDLEKRNNFINTILENLVLGIAVNFMDSGVTEYINPAYSSVYGWPAEDMKDIESFFKMIYPDPVYSEQQMKMVMEDINSGDPERMHWVNVRITTKTGEERFIEARNIPLPDQNLMISTAWDITERKRTEEALANSEQQFRSLYENATIGIYRTTPNGEIIMANPALVQMLGYSSFDELAARNLEEEGFESSYERKYFKEQIEKNGTLVGVEGVWHRKDGVAIYVRENSKAVRDSKGTMLFYDGTVEDITARKQAENLLQENNVRLELAMAIANMAWWEMDIATGNVLFDKRKVEMLGYIPEQFKHYTDFMALVHPDDHDKAMNAMRRHLEGVDEKYEIEYRIKTQSGVYRWFYDIGCITKKDENGSPLTVSGLVLNITEHKQAEEKLLISEIKYRSFFENSMDAIMLATDDGKILSANRAACQMFGYLEEELINGGRTRIMDVTDPRVSAFISERTLKGMARGELTLIRKDGTCFPSEISSALFETRDGQINTSIIIHDISVRNQAQKELNQQIIELQEWHEVSVGREEKIIELKREVNILLTSSGKKMKYDIDE